MVFDKFMRQTMPPSRQAFGDGIERLEAALRDPSPTAEVTRWLEPAPNALPYAGKVYSQNGEDGVIASIFDRIGVIDHTFIEIGVEQGLECNTRLLLECGWSGVWVEGDASSVREARETFASYIANGSLKVIEAHVKRETINDILDRAGVAPRVDFLSVDIDFNTTHVWRAIERCARLSCIEYNPSLPPTLDIEVPYDGAMSWDGTNYYGGSLKTIEAIGAAKHLKLIGCEAVGVNAFLVADEDAKDRFAGPFDAQTHYVPFAGPNGGHRPSTVARKWVVNPGRPRNPVGPRA